MILNETMKATYNLLIIFQIIVFTFEITDCSRMPHKNIYQNASDCDSLLAYFLYQNYD